MAIKEQLVLSVDQLPKNYLDGIDTLLFDLDGTLVDMDHRFELPLMLRGVRRFYGYIKPWRFPKVFWQAVVKIQSNDGRYTNQQVFLDHIQKNSTGSIEDIKQVFKLILEQDFPKAGKYFCATPGAIETLQLVDKLEIRKILATNPMFPLKAVKTRMSYGGIGDFDFEYITNSENCYSCKPHVKYYQQLLDKLKLDPSRCLMIGNDPVKDLPAMELGVKTFLLKGKKYNQKISKYSKHQHILGTHEDLRILIRGLV